VKKDEGLEAKVEALLRILIVAEGPD